MVNQSIKKCFFVLTASVCGLLPSALVFADPSTPAYKINGKVTTVEQLQAKEQDRFYQVAKEYHDLVSGQAREDYLQTYWADKAKAESKSIDAVKADAAKKEFGTSDAEFEKTYAQYKDHPSLKDLPEAEKKRQIRDFFDNKRESELNEKILADAERNKKLEILVPRPVEPVFNLTVTSNDHVRYGNETGDVKPVSCSGDACPITIVEYSEFQCPYCARVLDASKEILTAYKGKVRWITRDFPLNFHDRAKPAAIAAQCSGAQDPAKYWSMYYELFSHQQKLGDSDLAGYAKTIGLDMKKFDECVKNPKELLALIDTNVASGTALGVKGTPAFFINGRRLSGALPFAEFKRVIDEELNKVIAKK